MKLLSHMKVVMSSHIFLLCGFKRRAIVLFCFDLFVLRLFVCLFVLLLLWC